MRVVPLVRAVRRLVLLGVIVASLLLVRRAEAAPRKPVTLEVVFHVVDVDGKPVADDAFLDARIVKANQIFAPLGVAFTRNGTPLKLPAKFETIQDRPSRDALAPHLSSRRRGVIDCFVVRSFKDLGNPNEERRGVHWHVKARRGVHFVILSTNGSPDVLAHELGHFLGNPQHSEVPGNLMSYQRGPALPVLDDDQARRVDVALRGYLARRELQPVASQPLATSAR